MTPGTIISKVRADGVTMVLSAAGAISATGDRATPNRRVTVIREYKTGVVQALKGSADETAIARRWWLLHRLDCVPIEVAFDPAVTQAEIFERNRDVVKADQLVHQTPPMSAEGEMAIREWLALIGETDQGATIGFLRLADAAAEQWVVDQLEKMR